MAIVSKDKYSQEALMEVFGTPNPDPGSIVRWKWKWKHKRGKVPVENFNTALKILREANIDPLFYQIGADLRDEQSNKADEYFIAFYKEEHEVFFKLHAGIS